MCDNYFMDHPDVQARKFILPTILILLTIAGILIPILCYHFGYSITFVNILLIPLVITCISYPKRGMIYATLISICSFLPLLLIHGDSSLWKAAFIKVLGFEIIAFLIINLSKKKHLTDGELKLQQEKIDSIVQEKTEMLRRELEQSRRIETVSRKTMDHYDVCYTQLRLYYIQWNAELYITRTNEPFENLVGRVKSDLVGRRISTIPWLEETSRKHETGSVIIRIDCPDGKKCSVLWMFSEIFTEESDSPFMIIGTGIEIPKE